MTSRRYSIEDRGIIYQGCPVTTLAEIFRMKRQNVERKLAGCPVAAVTTGGIPLYHISDAAPYLVQVKLSEQQVVDALKKADPRDFPVMTNKMFWEGMIQRAKYREMENELWFTSDVAAVLSSTFNAIRMALLLLPDELSDNAGLNERQRTVVQRTVDSALEGCRETLVEELRKPRDINPDEDGEI